MQPGTGTPTPVSWPGSGSVGAGHGALTAYDVLSGSAASSLCLLSAAAAPWTGGDPRARQPGLHAPATAQAARRPKHPM